MAITVTTDLTNVDLAEATTNYAVLGTWATAISASVDTYIQSANTVGGRVSAATAWAHTSLAATDLSINQRHIFQWLKCISIPQLDTKANGGLVITMSSDATPTLVGVSPNDGPSNSKSWFVGGNTDTTFGWVCYVVDPNSTPSPGVVQGTPVVTAIQRIGIRGKIVGVVGGGAVKPVNIVFDATRYGTGLTYSGDNAGTPGAFSDILATAMSSANAWGILTSTSLVYFGAGKFNFGTAGQAAITSFKDTNQTFVYQDFPIANTFYEWVLAGAASFLTTVQLGNFVSSVASAGCVIRGAGNAVWTLTVGANSAFKAYASTLSQMRRATLTSTSELRSCTISSFGEITPTGATIDSCTFNTVVTTAPTSGTWALIFNATADATAVTNTKFISCNKAIKITAAGSYTFNNLTFSGNTFDIENSIVATQYDFLAGANAVTTSLRSASFVGVSQSFTGTGGTLSSASFALKKTGAPTGNAVVKLYAHSGTFGTSSIPTGAALATSDNINVANLTTAYVTTNIQFSTAAQQYALVNATNYVITVEYSGGSVGNTLDVGSNVGGHAGNYADLTGTTWTAIAANDATFSVYVNANVIINATSGANPGTFTNTSNGSTTIINSVTITITVLDSSGAGILNARVAVYKTSAIAAGSELLLTNTNASGVATTTFNYLVDTAVTIRVRFDSAGSTRYFPYESTGTIKSTGLSIIANMVTDTIAA